MLVRSLQPSTIATSFYRHCSKSEVFTADVGGARVPARIHERDKSTFRVNAEFGRAVHMLPPSMYFSLQKRRPCSLRKGTEKLWHSRIG